MLVLLGPPFDGTDEQYARLAEATGLLAYDLKTRLKPGMWGVVRALADGLQANELGLRLENAGFRVCVLDPALTHDPERRAVNVRAIELGDEQMVLQLRERRMPVPYKALISVVRGEIQLGRPSLSAGGGSSASMRAVAATAGDLALFRESQSQADAFAGADLHFATVLWSARIDARAFDFSAFATRGETAVEDLDHFVDHVAQIAGVRVDRNVRLSSVASFAARPPPMRSQSPIPGGAMTPRASIAPGGDERFDGYSRLVAEAERRTRRFIRASLAPVPTPR
jgi:hypothetical protein